jgi:GMP synthase (glutamine-hydrolysing)
MSLRILVLQHHPASPAGLVGERMAARDAQVTTIDGQHGTALPTDADRHDGLLILGGAMNAYADDLCPHFPALLALARAYAADRKPVLGICLGGQLLARAWGARVHIGTAPEFGIAALAPTREAAADPVLAGTTPPVPAMQWHDDTFDLPEGATPLLTGTACRNQAFRVAEVVYGFQCHFEADRQDMVDWAEYRRDVYGWHDFAAEVAGQARVHGAAAEAFGRQVADRWLDLVAARADGSGLCAKLPDPAHRPSPQGVVGASAQAGPLNSASTTTSTVSLTPIFVPGAGIPNAIPNSERSSVPCAEKPIRAWGSSGWPA